MTTSTDAIILEIENWSDHVLRWILSEEECSQEFREAGGGL